MVSLARETPHETRLTAILAAHDVGYTMILRSDKAGTPKLAAKARDPRFFIIEWITKKIDRRGNENSDYG